MQRIRRSPSWLSGPGGSDVLAAVLAIGMAMELAGCAGVARQIGEINFISTEEEVQMGAKFAQEIESELEILDDPIVTGYVDAITQDLVRHCRRQDIEYHVKIVNTEEINAFAVPGGFLYFNVGLIRAADTEAELAGVIGHEIGHVVERHSAKHLSKQLGIAMIAQLILGENPEVWKSLVANVLATGAMMRYSREAEREADADAIEEMVGAGFHPSGMVRFFEKIRELEKRTPSAVERFFATHPPTEERLGAAREAIAAMGDLTRLSNDSPEFHRIQGLLPNVPVESGGEEDRG